MIKKFLTIISLAVIIIAFGGIYDYKVGARSLQQFNEDEKPVKVAVLFYTDIDYMNSMRESLEKVQQENLGKVQYDFYNAEDNQDLQNKQLYEILQKKDVDLILVNLVKQSEAKYIIDRIKEKNIPVIFFGGTNIKTIKSYNKAHWIAVNPTEGGILQGKIIVELWNKNKDKIDKNRDNVLQYIMLKGPSDDLYVIERARNSILTANNAGIKTEELASVVSYWREEEAKNVTGRLLSRFGNNIEMIITSNDSMAIGAVKALQEQGYNTGDERMTIPVVGFDAIPKVQELIKEGAMAGSVIQETDVYANAFYTVGMNLVNNRNPLEGTDYKSEDEGVSIILEHGGIMTNSN